MWSADNVMLQTYGYNYLPLLLSLAAPPLSILLPNPLPPNAPSSVADTKYPYASLRKSLRLLVEDPDPLEELENDISYVYSGFAPISVRLVQCVAQKGGVLSNPAADKEKGGDKKGSSADGDGVSRRGGAAGTTLVQAHPIVGWKGFEDVVASIPGETVDIVQKLPGGQDGAGLPSVSSLSTSNWLGFCADFLTAYGVLMMRIGSHSASAGTRHDDGRFLPWRVHLHGDRCAALGGAAEQRSAGSFRWDFFLLERASESLR